MTVGGASGNNQRGAQSAPEVTFVLGSAAVTEASRQGLAPVALGQDSTTGTRTQASLRIEAPWVATDRTRNRGEAFV